MVKYLKGYKSLGSICSVVMTLIVSGAQPTKGRTRSPIELFWTAKKEENLNIVWGNGVMRVVQVGRSLASAVFLC